MINPNKIKRIEIWWDQFPLQLKLITKIRFFASFGAGGVIYLTSLIFNDIGLSATEIGLGFTISAVFGTVSRIIAGNYLNKKTNIKPPLRLSSLFGIIASFILIFSYNKISYIIGQIFIGSAAGIYWPCVEFAVPNFCQSIDNRKAYALVRSFEATGIFIGVITGSILSLFVYIKFVYFIDLICILIILNLIENNKRNLEVKKSISDTKREYSKKNWDKNSYLIIMGIILITTCLALVQVTLPLDLVSGGISRNPIRNEFASYLISFQLILLLILQWPIGNWISKKGRLFGLKLSLFGFGFSAILLSASSYLDSILGIFLIIIAIIICVIATTSFLPSSTDIIFQIAPFNKKGSAFALLSQCFAMGYFVQIIAGRLLDYFGNASNIWLGIFLSCFLILSFLMNKRI